MLNSTEELDIKSQAESFSNIKLSHLNNRALTIASKIARSVKSINGTVIKLQDKAIAVRLAEQVLTIDNPELNKLFREFMDEAFKTKDTIQQKEKAEAQEQQDHYYRGVKVQ